MIGYLKWRLLGIDRRKKRKTTEHQRRSTDPVYSAMKDLERTMSRVMQEQVR